MKVYLDASPATAPAGWVLANSSACAIAMLETGDVDTLSLCHDLGQDYLGNGTIVAKYLRELADMGSRKVPTLILVRHDGSNDSVELKSIVAEIRQIQRDRQ